MSGSVGAGPFERRPLWRRAGAWRGAFNRFIERHAIRLSVLMLLQIVIILTLGPLIIYAIGPGEVGVKWRRFGGGTETEKVYGEGTHLKWPWDLVYVYDVRAQALTQTYEALSSDGLHLTAEVSFRYRVVREQAAMLHKLVGPRYIETLVLPEVGRATRTAISKFATEALHSAQRTEIEDSIAQSITEHVGVDEVDGEPLRRLLMLHDVLLRQVIFPAALQAAIDRKMVERQRVLEYSYRVERERFEAERKQIEAGGIRVFQDIVGSSLTDNYLRWRGIDATLHLAQSPGSRVVIIGGRDGLPLILGSQSPDSPSEPRPPAAIQPQPGGQAPAPAPTGAFLGSPSTLTGAALATPDIAKSVPDPGWPRLVTPGLTAPADPATADPDPDANRLSPPPFPEVPLAGPDLVTPPRGVQGGSPGGTQRGTVPRAPAASVALPPLSIR